MSKTISYIVTGTFMCCCIDVTDGVVTATAPIMKWSLGKSLETVAGWVILIGGTIEELKEE